MEEELHQNFVKYLWTNFLDKYKNQYVIIHKDYQLAIKKIV